MFGEFEQRFSRSPVSKYVAMETQGCINKLLNVPHDIYNVGHTGISNKNIHTIIVNIEAIIIEASLKSFTLTLLLHMNALL